MDTWRQSFVFCKEQEYGQGQNTSDMFGYWYQAPPGATFTSTYTREGKKLRPVSSRTWTEINYGKVSGSWQIQFPLDYNHMELFMFVYDTYTFTPVTKLHGDIPIVYGRHEFKRTNDGITPSFCVRRKTLYRPVGAEGDLIDEIYGCMVTSCKISAQGGKSSLVVSMSGIFADQKLGISADYVVGALDGLDYRRKIAHPVQYSCMYIDNQVISDVMSMSVQLKNIVSLKHGVLIPVARSFTEDESSNTVSCMVFARDPKLFRQRVFTGGYGYGNSSKGETSLPLPELVIKSQNIDSRVEPTSDKSNLQIIVTDVVIKSMGWEGEGDVLVDRLDSVDCTSISIIVENQLPYMYDLSLNMLGEFNKEVSGITNLDDYVMIRQDPRTAEIICSAPDHLMLSPTYSS